jgi:hypothetical protein
MIDFPLRNYGNYSLYAADWQASFYAVLLSRTRPYAARPVSRLARAAFPPREPVTVGLATGAVPKKPMLPFVLNPALNSTALVLL